MAVCGWFRCCACRAWQTWTSVRSRAPAVSRIASTTPEATSVTAQQDTDSAQTGATVTVCLRSHTDDCSPGLILKALTQTHTHATGFVCVRVKPAKASEPVFASVCRCRRVCGCERRLRAHVPEQRRLLSVFLPPGFPPGRGPPVLHP